MSKSNAIAEQVFVENSTLRLAWYAFITIAGIGLITASAKIQVPFWPVPMTLQTLAIMVVFASGGMRLGLATIIGYLAIGYAGIPVFAGPVAGPLYFVGPTAGFLAGFVLAALIVGYGADRGWGKAPFKLFGVMLLADIAIFALGFFWLGFMFISQKSGMTLGAQTAFSIGVQPYILADLVKIAIAASIVPALWSAIKHLRG
ncbi:MAG: biotin transporter BioY [Devosiaceae bacterium]|nr:biotin transporter BioY [Devosiaceae bacterium]